MNRFLAATAFVVAGLVAGISATASNVAGLVAPISATASDVPRSMDAVDLVIDRDDLIGQTVTLTDCRMYSAGPKDFTCQGPGAFISVIWPPNKDDIRRGLRSCSGLFADGPKCLLSVTGRVDKVRYRSIGIHATALTWQQDLSQ
jgi:hypothetical protein